MGIYQGYIGIAVGLCLIYVFIRMINNQEDYKIKNAVKDILFSVISIIIGILIYGLISKIFLQLYNTNTSAYRGANKIGIINILSQIPNSLVRLYTEYYKIYFTDDIVKNSFYNRQILYGIMLIILVGYVIVNAIKTKKIKELIFEFLILLILPIGLNTIYIIVGNSINGILAKEPMLFSLIIYILIIEKIKIKKIRIFSIATIIIVIYTYIISANATYVSMDLTNRQTLSIAQEILDDIQEQNKDNTKKVCLAGRIQNDELIKNSKVYSMNIGYIGDWNSLWNDYNGCVNCWKRLFIRYFGYKINVCSKKEYMNIIHSEQFRNMKTYQTEPSTEIINNIIVIKLDNNPPVN